MYMNTYTNKHTSKMFTHLCLIIHNSFHKVSCLSAHFTWNPIKAVTHKFQCSKMAEKLLLKIKEGK